MSDKKKTDKHAPVDNKDREKIRQIIDEREREYQLQVDTQADLLYFEGEFHKLGNELDCLNPNDSDFLKDQADLLKGLHVLDEEFGELKKTVGEDLLKRIGVPYFTVEKERKELIDWVTGGALNRESGYKKAGESRPVDLANEEAVATISDESEPSENETIAPPASSKGRISSITIENFKGIGEKVTIPLKPITLLFGANSAGKSTVLQALLYAHEVMNNRNPDADVTEFGGEKINLGGFRNLVHGHDLTKCIKIGFEYVLSDDGLPLYGLERNYSGNLRDELFYDSSIFKALRTVFVEFAVRGESGMPIISSYEVKINGENVASLGVSGPAEGVSLLDLVLDHIINPDCGLPEAETVLGMQSLSLSRCLNQSVARAFDPSFEKSISDEEIDQILKKKNLKFPDVDTSEEEEIVDFIEDMIKNFAPEMSPLRLPAGCAIPVWGAVIPFEYDHDVGRHAWSENEDTAVGFAALSAIIAGPGELIAKELEQMRYIGPIRAVPPRNYSPQKTKTASRWADGLAGWDVLLNDIIAGRKWFDQSAYDKLELGYEFLNCWEMTIPSSEIEKCNDVTLKDMLLKTSGQNTVRMRDVESRTNVEPCDVGTGVSQVIPVVAGAMAPGCRFLSVEQPELHLHPAIQCNLGDLFISQSKRYPERTFLLETHSEHLILRLLRRIRETSENNLEDPSLALAPDDVGVLYVEEAENGVRIKELPITPEGDFSEKWPQGFFDERAEELF